jgi:GNAT superfamily N-acetyltransferase
LFVRGDRHRQGIGRRLVEHCEQECARLDSGVIRLAATLYAVPFYLAMGYRKSSGIRNAWSFEGTVLFSATGLLHKSGREALASAGLATAGEIRG